MQLFNNILIPTDFSPAAWNAVQLALKLVGTRRSSLTLLHIFPNTARFDKVKTQLGHQDQRTIDNIREQMEEFCQGLGARKHVKINSVISVGGVEEEILQYMEENTFDLIIMGVNSNGMDNQPGSHLATIIEKANTPVLVMPNKITQKVAV